MDRRRGGQQATARVWQPWLGEGGGGRRWRGDDSHGSGSGGHGCGGRMWIQWRGASIR